MDAFAPESPWDRLSAVLAVSLPVVAGEKLAICPGVCASGRILQLPFRWTRPLHPVQLYESAADLLIFALLYRYFQRSHREGGVIGGYLILYSTARFIIEFFREHEQSLVGPFSLTQWIALGLFWCSGISPSAIVRCHARSRSNPIGFIHPLES